MTRQLTQVSIQYLEIYNEALYDLLDISTQPDELSIYENSRGVVTVSGLKSKVVGSEAEAMQLLFEVREHMAAAAMGSGTERHCQVTGAQLKAGSCGQGNCNRGRERN